MQQPSQEAIEMLERAVNRSKRTRTVRLPPAFARDSQNKNPSPPLHRILYRSKGVRLKVFLTTLMMATKAPHRKKYTLLTMAQLLNLKDPKRAGRRRVGKALKDLEERGLIRRVEQKGHTPEIQILKPDGSREEKWSDRAAGPYIGIPISLWRKGWLHSLSESAIGLIIILLDLRRKNQEGVWLDGIRKRQYGFSDDFWTKATKELEKAKLLSVGQTIASSQGEPRQRNVYTLHLDRLETHYPSGERVKNVE